MMQNWSYVLVTIFLSAFPVAAGSQEVDIAPSNLPCTVCGYINGVPNSVQFPTGVVEFEYKGQNWKNNCNKWEVTVTNPNAISSDICRSQLILHTYVICRCTTPDGRLLSDFWSPPTISPAPTLSPAPAGPQGEKDSKSAKSSAPRRGDARTTAMTALVAAMLLGPVVVALAS
jgi:hypothetical protein